MFHPIMIFVHGTRLSPVKWRSWSINWHYIPRRLKSCNLSYPIHACSLEIHAVSECTLVDSSLSDSDIRSTLTASYLILEPLAYIYKTVSMLPQPHWMKISRLSENLSWKNLICARMLSSNAQSTCFKIYLSCVGLWHQREILVSMPMLIPLYDGKRVPFLTRRSRQDENEPLPPQPSPHPGLLTLP
jgi:hypothetical protein